MMRNGLWALMVAAMFASVAVCAAQPVGIVAVVNDQVVSTLDIEDRMRLIAGTTGIELTDENRARLAQQVLRQLVDEKLEMQEAAKLSITVSDSDLQDGIAAIERQSNKPPGSLEAYLASKGVPKLSFYSQVRAQIAWADIVAKKVRPKVKVSEAEIARYIARKEASPSKDEVKIEILMLPVDSPKNETNVKKLAEKLASDIKGGANFEAVATQFTSGSAGNMLDPFWVELSQMNPDIAKAVAQIKPGEITPPVRTDTGYQIVKLVDQRRSQTASPPADIPAGVANEELVYKQILMTLKHDTKPQEAEMLLKLAREVAKSPGKCQEKTMAGVGDLADMDFKLDLIRTQTSELSEPLRTLLSQLKVGAVSEPIVTKQGIELFMLCERVDLGTSVKSASDKKDEDKIRQAIFQEKMELEAQKHLRNLRREAFIEIRK